LRRPRRGRVDLGDPIQLLVVERTAEADALVADADLRRRGAIELRGRHAGQGGGVRTDEDLAPGSAVLPARVVRIGGWYDLPERHCDPPGFRLTRKQASGRDVPPP